MSFCELNSFCCRVASLWSSENITIITIAIIITNTRENIGREWKRALSLVRNFLTVWKMRPPPVFCRDKVSVTFLTNKITVNTLLVAPKDDDSPSFLSNISETYRRFFFNYTSFGREIIDENSSIKIRSGIFDLELFGAKQFHGMSYFFLSQVLTKVTYMIPHRGCIKILGNLACGLISLLLLGN